MAVISSPVPENLGVLSIVGLTFNLYVILVTNWNFHNISKMCEFSIIFL